MSVIIPQTDEDYHQWIKDNLVGFVANTNKVPSSKFMVLHTNKCLTINELSSSASGDAFTNNSYTKICANSIEDLESWLTKNKLSFSKECQKCNPRDPLVISEKDAKKLMAKFNKEQGKNYPREKLLSNRDFIISLIRKGEIPEDAFNKATE